MANLKESKSFKNLRLRIGCKLISIGIRIMPKDWRTKTSINNLMATNMIQNSEKGK